MLFLRGRIATDLIARRVDELGTLCIRDVILINIGLVSERIVVR